MAKIYYTLLNPIRGRSGNATTSFPTIDKMRNNYDHQRGLISNKEYIPEYKLNQQIVIQIQTELEAISASTGVLFKIVTPSGSVVDMTRNDVTPIGWVGTYVYNYSYTPTVEGQYYIYSVNNASLDFSITTDTFYVRNTDSDMVEIKYYDTNNKYGGIFYNHVPTLVWQPRAYFTGIVKPAEPKNTYSTYLDDPGIERKLNSEPQRMIELILSDVSMLYKDKINYIFSCNNIWVNNMPCQNSEAIVYDIPDEKSDLRNIRIKLMLTDNDNFVKNH